MVHIQEACKQTAILCHEMSANHPGSEEIRNVELRKRATMERMETTLMKRRLTWLGHVERMSAGRIPHKLMVSKPEGGKQSVGSQNLRWVDVVTQDLRACGIEKTWKELGITGPGEL